jgi:hypothetical protein
MKMYTSVEVRGNSILYRGYENGTHVKKTVDYKPTLYVRAGKAGNFKTIHNEALGSIAFEGIRAARDYISNYKDVSNVTIYGMDKFEYCYIAEQFPNDIEWSIDKINIMALDIEVSSEGGYSTVEAASQKITAITFNNRSITIIKYINKNKREVKLLYFTNKLKSKPPIAIPSNDKKDEK